MIIAIVLSVGGLSGLSCNQEQSGSITASFGDIKISPAILENSCREPRPSSSDDVILSVTQLSCSLSLSHTDDDISNRTLPNRALFQQDSRAARSFENHGLSQVKSSGIGCLQVRTGRRRPSRLWPGQGSRGQLGPTPWTGCSSTFAAEEQRGCHC